MDIMQKVIPTGQRLTLVVPLETTVKGRHVYYETAEGVKAHVYCTDSEVAQIIAIVLKQMGSGNRPSMFRIEFPEDTTEIMHTYRNKYRTCDEMHHENIPSYMSIPDTMVKGGK